MNAADKAWLKRKRTPYTELLKRYQEKHARALKRLDRAGLAMTRASAFYSRKRDEVKSLARKIADAEEQIGQGKLYPDLHEPKKKNERRRIEL